MRHYLRHLDHLMLATAIAISAFGLWIIENATANDIPGNPRYYFNRELAYVVVGTAGMLILAAIPPSVFRALPVVAVRLRAGHDRSRCWPSAAPCRAASGGSTSARSSSSRPSSASCS